jgi:hypothetical protein
MFFINNSIPNKLSCSYGSKPRRMFEMATLLDLEDEILVEILSHLSEEKSLSRGRRTPLTPLDRHSTLSPCAAYCFKSPR